MVDVRMRRIWVLFFCEKGLIYGIILIRNYIVVFEEEKLFGDGDIDCRRYCGDFDLNFLCD